MLQGKLNGLQTEAKARNGLTKALEGKAENLNVEKLSSAIDLGKQLGIKDSDKLMVDATAALAKCKVLNALVLVVTCRV